MHFIEWNIFLIFIIFDTHDTWPMMRVSPIAFLYLFVIIHNWQWDLHFWSKMSIVHWCVHVLSKLHTTQHTHGQKNRNSKDSSFRLFCYKIIVKDNFNCLCTITINELWSIVSKVVMGLVFCLFFIYCQGSQRFDLSLKSADFESKFVCVH